MVVFSRSYKDVSDYYGLPVSKIKRLGTRLHGRKPDLPPGKFFPGMPQHSLEEIWASKPRKSPHEKEEFWRDVGTYFVFRQCVRNRHRSFRFILRRQPARFLEWGAGVCPASVWLIQRGLRPANLTVVDVPSEHFTFGVWRLRRLVRRRSPCTVLRVLDAAQDGGPTLSWIDYFDGATCLETLEHLPSPLQAIQEISAYLVTGGWLWEDFRIHGPGDEGAPWDLPQAQAERKKVYEYLQQAYDLIDGKDWRTLDGGGTRGWCRK